MRMNNVIDTLRRSTSNRMTTTAAVTPGAQYSTLPPPRRRAPSRYCGDARVYGCTATTMHDNEYLSPPAPRMLCRTPCAAGATGALAPTQITDRQRNHMLQQQQQILERQQQAQLVRIVIVLVLLFLLLLLLLFVGLILFAFFWAACVARRQFSCVLFVYTLVCAPFLNFVPLLTSLPPAITPPYSPPGTVVQACTPGIEIPGVSCNGVAEYSFRFSFVPRRIMRRRRWEKRLVSCAGSGERGVTDHPAMTMIPGREKTLGRAVNLLSKTRTKKRRQRTNERTNEQTNTTKRTERQ